MKLNIDTGSGEDDILSRAYVAAVVGPYRRPQGRTSNIALAALQGQQIAANNTPDRVLFVTVSSVVIPPGLLFFSKDSSGGAQTMSLQTESSKSFILYPGETLQVTNGANAPFPISVNEQRF